VQLDHTAPKKGGEKIHTHREGMLLFPEVMA